MNAVQSSASPRLARHRGAVACRRCRRQRAKCIHDGARPPCRRCALAGGETAASCCFPARGEKDTDRRYRNPRLVPGHMPARSISTPSDDAFRDEDHSLRDATPVQAMPSAPPLEPVPSVRPESSAHPRPPSSVGPLYSLPTPSHAHNEPHHQHSLPTASSPPLPHRNHPVHPATAPNALQSTDNNIDPVLARPSSRHHPSHFSSHAPARSSSQHTGHHTSPPTTQSSDADWPPHCEVVEGCRTFVTCYFQLGFLPKAVFLEKLAAQDSSSSSSSSPSSSAGCTSRFLLCCILSISSRFTPSLVRRYGSKAAATDHFLQLAQRMAPSEMYTPSLERVQAFFLLSIAEWGNSDRDRSAMDMGVAVRQAVVLKLHREETYCLPPTATADAVVQAESARRTFWMIHSQENLHSGTTSPAPVPVEDITALLPCNETDFAFGEVPATRAALAGTPPARAHPELVFHPHRCLFATLIQAHSLWGHVARHAAPGSCSLGWARPWEPGSLFASITASLRVWEAQLPARHRWSLWNLRGWRAEGLHLAYLSVVMVLRLGNIVVRRVYLDNLVQALSGPNSSDTTAHAVHAAATPASLATTPPSAAADQEDSAVSPCTIPTNTSNNSNNNNNNSSPPPGFWQQVSHDIFDNVVELHEQVVAYFRIRTRDEGFPPILVFCVYVCGSLASDLWHNPCLCPHVTPAEAEDMAMSTLRILGELYQAWPVSARWQLVLRHIAGHDAATVQQQQQQQQGREKSDEAPVSAAGGASGPGADAGENARQQTGDGVSVSQSTATTAGQSGDANGDETRPAGHGSMLMADFPNELFSAQLAEYLEGSVHYGLLDGLYFKP